MYPDSIFVEYRVGRDMLADLTELFMKYWSAFLNSDGGVAVIGVTPAGILMSSPSYAVYDA